MIKTKVAAVKPGKKHNATQVLHSYVVGNRHHVILLIRVVVAASHLLNRLGPHRQNIIVVECHLDSEATNSNLHRSSQRFACVGSALP